MIDVWLTNGSEKIWFPVNPMEEFTTTAPAESDSVDLIGVGEVSIIKKPRLMSWTFSSFFPKEWGPYCNYKSLKDPSEYVKLILKWKDSGVPSRFIVTGAEVELNYSVTIESFNFTDKAGEVGDIHFEINLKEYKYVAPKQVVITIVNPPPPPSPRPVPPAPPAQRTYTVVRGDCLWNIAKKFYGKGSQWPTIYNANKGVIGGNPNLIYPGQKYIIP